MLRRHFLSGLSALIPTISWKPQSVEEIVVSPTPTESTEEHLQQQLRAVKKELDSLIDKGVSDIFQAYGIELKPVNYGIMISHDRSLLSAIRDKLGMSEDYHITVHLTWRWHRAVSWGESSIDPNNIYLGDHRNLELHKNVLRSQEPEIYTTLSMAIFETGGTMG